MPRQIRLLSARNELVRVSAAEELGAMGLMATDAVPELVIATTDSEPAVRRAAAEALRRITPDWSQHPDVDRAVPKLIERLTSQFTDVWQAAVNHLRRIGPAAVRGLTAALADDARPGSRVHLLHVLGQIGPPAAESAAVVVRLLRSDEAHVRVAAADTLTGLRSCAVEHAPDLMALTGDRYPPARAAAVRALVSCGLPEDVVARAILSLLLDGSGEVHSTVADVVTKLGPVTAGLLTEFLAANSFDFAERWCEECVRLMGQPSFDAQCQSGWGKVVVAGRDEKQWEELRRNAEKVIVNRMWVYAEADERAVAWERARETALRGLATLGPPPHALPHLTAGLDSPNRGVRTAAVRALGRLGAEARPAIPDLALAFLTASEPVRKDIRDALPAIDPEWRQHPDLGDTATKLIQHLNGTAETVEEAAEAIRFVGPSAVPGLLKALAGRDRTRQERAADLLGDVGAGAAGVIPALDAVAADPIAHGWVREAAKRAAGRLRTNSLA